MRESDEAKKARLAEALRQNLRRRKAQEREMESEEPTPTPGAADAS